MEILDNKEQIKKIDSKNMADSISNLNNQILSAWDNGKNTIFPKEFRNVSNIIFVGMGGSALGAHIVRSVFDINLPFQIVNHYTLPSFISEKSLVIVSSYSGNTEEVLSAISDAKSKKAKICGISGGGELIEILKTDNHPFIQYDLKYNPSGNPRLGLGYSISALLSILSKLGFTHLEEGDVKNIADSTIKLNNDFDIDTLSSENNAKKSAIDLHDKIFNIVAGPFLTGNAHTFANQINESAKTFGNYFVVSEMNHHLLEGIKYPESSKKTLHFLQLESPLYEEKIKIRMEIGKNLLLRSGIGISSYQLKSITKSAAVFEALLFSSWTSYYMAILNHEDPSKIPNVDYFKTELDKKV